MERFKGGVMRNSWLLVLCVAAAALGGCGGDSDGKKATPVPSSPTPVATATRTAPATATVTVQPTSTVQSTSTATIVPTNTVVPSATAPPTATATPPATATVTATASATSTQTPSLGDELSQTGIGKYLGQITPVSMTEAGDWELHAYDPADKQAICMRGDPYRVELHRGTNNKVLLYLEGGGACWNNDNCWVNVLAKLKVDPEYRFGGIFDFNNPDNPFHDWNVVFAPYCDGSVFSGDKDAEYPGGLVYHHGLRNLSAAVTLMRDRFPNPEQIAVAGSSAGGYGTYSGYGVTRVAYPDAPIVVLNDSGPGLQNLADSQAMLDRETNWDFQQFVPPTCERCPQQLTYLTEWALERDPTARVGYYSNLRDGVIRSFNQLTAEQYEALLRTTTDDLHSRQPDRFRRFFVQGEGHTILELPNFYTTEIAGLSFRDWTADLLDDGPRWQDVIEGYNPFKGISIPRYANPAMWMCRPDLAVNQCLVDLDATAVQPDNSLVVEPHTAADDPDYDCFYIYPTVDLSATPGNHTDFSDISFMLDPLLSQAARFNGSCRVFAPLYRQVTLGTYGAAEPQRQQFFDLAYSDVSDAFRHYMGQYNNGRNFVIMGHSQGTGMVTRLLGEFIDGDPQLRERLIVALLVGGDVTVPDGQPVGGTFDNLPLCTSDDQTGCVIAYRSYAAGFPPANGANVVGPDGMDTACTNPAALGGGKAYFRNTYLPLMINQPLFRIGTDIGLPIETPFAEFKDFYSGECVKDDRGRSYLRIAVEPGPGDQRVNPIPFDNPVLSPAFLGTHILDYNFAMGDLIRLVQDKAAALAAAQRQ